VPVVPGAGSGRSGDPDDSDDPDHSDERRSRPHRKAASVLPDPVGARIRVCSPEAMAGQPCSWAGVGAGNDEANHSLTAGENASRTTPPT
jgi:hypothetical protein